MVLTRSESGKKKNEESGSSSEETRTSGDTTTATSGTTTTETTATTDTTGTTTSTVTNKEKQPDTSGIAATPAGSATTLIPTQTTMPPPPAVRPARSRRSKASSKRLLAELEVKERLAELELQRVRAEAALEKIRLQKITAESDTDSELEQEDLAPRRVTEWFDKQQGAAQEEQGKGRPDDRIEEAPRPPLDRHPCPRSGPATIEVATLSAALTEAIQASKSMKKYIPELPIFGGQTREWLHFKATYEETALSFSSSENVARIKRSLKGAALEAVSALLISRPRPEDIITALERRYGRPDALLLEELEKMKTLPRLTENPRDLCVLASRIANTTATIRMLNKPQYLYNPEILRLIVDKLTPILRNKWYDFAAQKEDEPELEKISSFLNKEADKCAPYAPPEQPHSYENKEAKPARRRTERTYVVQTETHKNKQERSCPACKTEEHALPACPLFKKASTNERWEIAKKNRICYRCLSSRHQRLLCKARPCGRHGCPMRHHQLLHHDQPAPINNALAPPAPAHEENIVASTTEITATAINANRAYLKIAPVTLHGPRASINTYALLDEGSTVTIIDEELANSLGLDGPLQPMWVQGVSGTETSYNNSKKVTVSVQGNSCNERYPLDARTVSSINFTTQSVREQEIADCRHLEDIKENLLYEDVTPKLLIGQDNWELIISQEIRRGRRDQLVASRTSLGWVLHGCRTSHTAPIAYCCAHITQRKSTDDIEEKMKKYFALESLNIEPRRPKNDPELQALQILEEKSRRLPSGRYETGLLWRGNETEDIPNNKRDALNRLYTLEKKLDRDSELKAQYHERIENLLQSNYAEIAAAMPTNRTWYLPHFAVRNPAKQKIRVVHDAAAISHGRSLNSMLLSGPDLLQSLPGVIMRFRQHRYAVSADIKEMFMQIKIREEDRDALRFLWRGDRREGEPTEYRMTSVIFGATSSPCTALYIKNKNAQEHAAEFPRAADAIERNHYMDDYLQSFATIKEAQEVTREVDFVHSRAGFQLRGWTSNNKEAVNKVSTSERDSATSRTGGSEREDATNRTGGSERDDATNRTGGSERDGVTVSLGGNDMEKALGLLWNTGDDTIRFQLNTRTAPTEITENRRPPTKREALSIIMSIFDPLGLISVVTTPAKRIMQDAWQYNTQWDEVIPEELRDRWSTWIQQLHNLGGLRIPRCYDVEPAARYELHTFVDASEGAYAAAAYWRMTRADGSIKVALAAAKSRVSPKKPISIPRLELQAAVLGARLARSTWEQHDFEIAAKTYWSDSRTVLAWIRAEPRSFKAFVAHRLAEIEDLTKKSEWRWVPTADNVADDATREIPTNFDERHRWYRGPPFLYNEENTWPIENKVDVRVPEEEKQTCNVLQASPEHPHLPHLTRFSKWTRLIRSTARVLQFIALCRGKVDANKPQLIAAAKRKRTRANPEADSTWVRNKKKTGPSKSIAMKKKQEDRKYLPLEAQYLEKAEEMWIRAAQEDSYVRERRRIRLGSAPDKDDKLAHLSTYIDESGIVRLKSRIAAAEGLTHNCAYPIVLHGKHLYTKLYIQHVHERLHHGGSEIVVNELRQKLHIERIRPAVKEVIARCPRCALRKAKPATPSTGDLPPARLAHHTRPFTYTGLDYFGPIQVTVGRRHDKRYVALFTCMTTRAIHLEVVPTLSADSAINALRRFVARRGSPRELWSDNATAFRKANLELTEEMKKCKEAQRITWRFLPPAAPFMAGVWERMVRTVKEALKVTLHEKYPSDETLQTLLAEVEMTVNSRPLSYVPVGPNDPPSLTPNMILIGPESSAAAPGVFNEDDANARHQWRRAQQLADVFWRRWVREYLPLLQRRQDPTSTGTRPAEGDLVIICDSNLPRNVWPRGRVTKTYPGADGEVRVVDVTTSRGHVLRRPTKKIVVLPVGSQGDGGRNVNDAIIK